MWRRRKLIGTVGNRATGFAVATNRTKRPGGHPSEDGPQHAAMRKSCCDTCADCAKACNKAFHHCVTRPPAGKPQHAKMAQIVSRLRGLLCSFLRDAAPKQHHDGMLAARPVPTPAGAAPGMRTRSIAISNMKTCVQECQRCEDSCRKMVKTMEPSRSLIRSDRGPRPRHASRRP